MKKSFLALTPMVLFVFTMNSFLLKAQYQLHSPVFGTDIKVSDAYNATDMASKVKVADNGWIYILTRYVFNADVRTWRMYCSKDQGKTYKMVSGLDYTTSLAELNDADFVVTGSDSASMAIFVAVAVTQGVQGTYPSNCQVIKYDAAGTMLKVVYEYDWAGRTVTHVAITDDHRYPSLNSSFPFSVGVVWVGGDAAAGEDHLTYAISNDGGETYTDHFMYNQVWPGRLGKACISMGCNSDIGPGLVGVAFEMNSADNPWGTIGVIVNYYDLSGGWTTPVKIGEGDFAASNRNPTISLRLSSAGWPSPYHFSLITGYEHMGADVNSQACYALMDYTYFYYGCPQAQPTDLTYHYINPVTSFSTTELNFNYNRQSDQYYLTYLTTDINQLHFSTIDADPLSALTEKATFRDFSTYVGWFMKPCVDGNPVTGNAYFSWTDVDSNGENVYADSEESVLGINQAASVGEHLVAFPSPANDRVTIQCPGSESFGIAVTDLACSELIKCENCRSPYQLDVSGLSPGVYFIQVHGNGKSATGKIVIEH